MNERLDLVTFGRRLLETNDLDPVYVMLWEAKLPRPLLRRWLLAYWCFYHSGTASWIASQPKGYWDAMETAAGSKEYPRCHERRHFRGENARKSVAFLRSYGIEPLFRPLEGREPVPLKDVMAYVQTWVGFGPWISFKVADMLERLDILPVQFDDASMFLFDAPRQGASLAYRTFFSGKEAEPTKEQEWAVNYLVREFRRTPSPPRYDRPFNAQEAETILCKWKSHMNGHYRVGEDIESLRKGLLKFAKNRLAQTLLRAGKSGGLW